MEGEEEEEEAEQEEEAFARPTSTVMPVIPLLPPTSSLLHARSLLWRRQLRLLRAEETPPRARPPLPAPSSRRLSSSPSQVGVRCGVGGHRMIDFRGVRHTGAGPTAGPPPLPPPLPSGECGPALLSLEDEKADWGPRENVLGKGVAGMLVSGGGAMGRHGMYKKRRARGVAVEARRPRMVSARGIGTTMRAYVFSYRRRTCLVFSSKKCKMVDRVQGTNFRGYTCQKNAARAVSHTPKTQMHSSETSANVGVYPFEFRSHILASVTIYVREPVINSCTNVRQN